MGKSHEHVKASSARSSNRTIPGDRDDQLSRDGGRTGRAARDGHDGIDTLYINLRCCWAMESHFPCLHLEVCLISH